LPSAPVKSDPETYAKFLAGIDEKYLEK